MFSNKKKMFGALVGTAALFALTACGGGEEADQGADAADADATADAAEGEITLTIPMLGITDEQLATAEELGELDTIYNRMSIATREEVEATMPDNVTVEFVDWGWAEALDQQQRSMIAAGNIPDLVAGEVFMPSYAAEDILYPLPQDIVDSVNPSFLIENNDGEPVAVATRSSVFMLFYNRDLLEAAGFETGPATWEEWQHMSDTITEVGNGEFFGGGIPSFPHAGGALRATPFFRQLGTDFFVDGEVQLDSPEVIQTLEFIREMNRNFPIGLGNGASEDPLWNAFEVEQNIAFGVNGTWAAAALERNNANWGVVALPLPEGGQEGNTLVGASFVAVPRGAAHPELSFDVMRAAFQPHVSEIWLEESVPSPRRDIIEDPSRWEHDEVLSLAVEAVSGGEVSGLVAFPSNSAEIWEIINTQVLARTTMTEDPIETIVAEAAALIENQLN